MVAFWAVKKFADHTAMVSLIRGNEEARSKKVEVLTRWCWAGARQSSWRWIWRRSKGGTTLPLISGQLWRGRTVSSAFKDQIALQRVLHLAERTIDAPCLKDIYTRPCKNKAKRIIKDPDHLYSGLFSLRGSKHTRHHLVNRCMGSEIIITGQKTE